MDKPGEEIPIVRFTSPQTPTPPVLPRPPNEFWKGFFDLTGGSLFYCLSALSIIYGITQIMGPLLLKNGVLGDTLPCIGTLNLYELALLGTLAFIVVGQNVTDDAISLVVLIPLFLVGSGISLDTVANNGPALAIGIGLLCAVLGGGKLAVLRQVIRVPFGRLALVGLSLVVVWNFFAGPYMVKQFIDHAELVGTHRSFWLGNLLILLVAGTLVLVEMARHPGPFIDKNTPFLRSSLMTSVFALVLLGASSVHLYAMGFQFDVRFGDGDFVLLGAVGLLIVQEAMLRFGGRLRNQTAVVGCGPLVGAVIVLMNDGFTAPFCWGLELLGHPCTVLVVGALGMVRLALRTRWAVCWYIAGVYGLGVVLTGFCPSSPADFNWRLCGGLLVMCMLAAGIILRKAELCVVALIGILVGLGMSKSFEPALRAIGLEAAGGVAGVGGLGLLAIVAVFKDKVMLPLAFIGAAALIGCGLDFLNTTIGWRDLVVLLILVAVAGVMWWRVRNWTVVLILAVPVVDRLWLLFRTLSTWRYVVLSFVLLGVGAWLSTIKSRKVKSGDLTKDHHASS